MGGAMPCGLAYSEVVVYAAVNGFDRGEELDRFVTLVYAQDQEFLAWWNKKASKAATPEP